MQSLNLSGSLTGELTDLHALDHFYQLHTLNLSDNNLQYPPHLVLPRLQRLDLHSNNLQDVLPVQDWARTGVLAEVNLLGNYNVPCEQLEQLRWIASLELQAPLRCRVGEVPELGLLYPSGDRTASAGEVISFAANASDWEDGDISQGIRWTSDIDGALGHGAYLDVTLNDGVHRITVSVQDSDGNQVEQGFTVTVEAAGAEYCVAQGSETTYEWIAQVGLNGHTNPSGASSGYTDFPSLVLPLHFGMNELSLSPGYRWSSYWEHWRVWIDVNHDGEFTEQERVASYYGSAPHFQYFMLPSDARSGVTRMRVAMSYGSAASPCGTFYYGEVEDYSVMIP